MHARVTPVAVQPDKVDEIVATTDSEIIPEMKDDPGFKGFYVLGDRSTGESLVITMWETEDDEQTSRPKVGQRFGVLMDYLAGQPEPSRTYEVIHSYVPVKSSTM